ncbi:MAG: AI-2E family transporter [Anaerolineae bacterium]|nr:AI-2E family transporter [Anaerolineae bacterium]
MSRFELPYIAPRQIISATLVLLAILLAFWLFYRFHQVVIIFFLAIVISTAIQPAVRWLHQIGIPRPVSVVAVYLSLLALLVGFISVLTPLTLTQMTRLAAALPEVYAEGRNSLLDNSSFFVWRLGLALPEQLPLTGLMPLEDSDVTTAVRQGGQAISLLLKTMFAVVAVLTLTFYWTLDGKRTTRSLLLWLPLDWRETTRSFIEEAETKVGAYVTGQALLCASIGGMALIAYLLLGLPYALPLAILAGIMELIPYLGPMLGALPAMIVAYSINPILAVGVVVVTIIMQQLENSVLLPRIMNHSVGVHPLVTLLAITAFGLLFGLVGVLVAIPIAAIVQIVFNRSFIAEQPIPVGRDQVSVLRYEVQDLMQDIRKQIRFKEEDASAESDQIEDLLETIAAELDELLLLNRPHLSPNEPSPQGEEG